jgi:hypothetical protein
MYTCIFFIENHFECHKHYKLQQFSREFNSTTKLAILTNKMAKILSGATKCNVTIQLNFNQTGEGPLHNKLRIFAANIWRLKYKLHSNLNNSRR